MKNVVPVQEILIFAAELGYFRSKDADKKTAIAEETVKGINANSESGHNLDIADVLVVLNAESAKRSEAHKRRERARIARSEAESAKPVYGGSDSPSDHVETYPMPASGRYVITTAQNNTEIDREFFAALMTYCRETGAQLLVAKTTYNKNGFQQPGVDNEELWYAPEVKPYLVAGHIELSPDLHFVADANIIPTAKNPVSGFEGITPAGVSCILPAVKISLKCTAALAGANGKILFSTGAVTKRNYILRKAGAVAQAEHNIGAVIVDLNASRFAVRHIERMQGYDGFYDECVYYSGAGMKLDRRAEALQFGDLHAEKMTPENHAGCMRLLEIYYPNHVLAHDVLDFSSRNHHNIKDATFIYAQHVAGNTVAGDLQAVAKLLDGIYQRMALNATLHVIESNHDLAINTWLKNADFKDDPANASVYLRCMLAWYQHIESRDKSTFNMLKFACKEIGGSQYAQSFDFHETDESVIIAGVEMGCHGHTGINGSRGSPAQFRTLGIPMNTGHTHTPSITGAVYTAGVSASLDMGYNTGPSSWKLAHVLTWPNGQRQIIFM